MTPNTHPTTGIRYTVYAMKNLDPGVYQELWYGSGAVDITYEEAYEEELSLAIKRARYEAEVNGKEFDEADFIEDWECPEFEIDEPNIAGTYDGVRYEISWLGGAPLLWVLESPHRFFGNLCSPCCPGAVDFDSGPGLFEGYGVPDDWISKC